MLGALSFVILFIKLICCDLCPVHPEVTTGLGSIRGSIMQTFKGNDFFAFRGIRYAKAPVGELRFKAPVPVEKWNHNYDATKDGVSCPTQNVPVYNEDCLMLNIYSKFLNTSANQPIIFYIHHGGFYMGSGTSKFSGPDYLLEHNVVLVTFNYRLGSFGFLSTGTEAAPGNAGLKDQVLALRWIKNHAHHFGGNPNLITILGYSAGALSASLHLVSPMSRGLFQHAVIMSSAVMPHVHFPTHQLHLARRQAEICNCTGEDWFDCLHSGNVTDVMVDKLYDMFEFGRDNPVYLWLPVVEPDFGQERFLTKNPVKQFEVGDFYRIPIITGVTNDEFIGSGIELSQNAVYLKEFNYSFEDKAPICFLYERGTNRSIEITQELKQFYLKFPLNDSSYEELGKLFSDAVISFPVNRLATLASKFTDVFYYKYNYRGEKSFSNLGGKPIGVSHCDDISYLLWMSILNYNSTSKEVPIIDRQTKILVDFASTGKPFADPLTWPKFTAENGYYLNIDEELTVKQNLFHDRFALWDRLFPTSSNL